MRSVAFFLLACIAVSTAYEMALDDELIRKLNRDADLPWIAGRNNFFEGRTMDDVKPLFGTKLQLNEPFDRDGDVKYSHDYDTKDEDIPATFNALKQWPKSIHPIRNQEKCGSCWAFSASEVLSDRFAIATNNTINKVLSPQDMVSCDTGDNGCGGGQLPFAWSYLQSTGIVTDSCLPYESGAGKSFACPNKKCLDHEKWRKYKASSGYALSTVKAIQKDLLAHGPVQTGFMVYKSFMSYKSGVYTKSWLEFTPVGGHAVKIVGWGTENGTDYWLVANSWGTEWGLKGFFKIKRGVNECGIEKNAYAGLPDTSSAKSYRMDWW